MGKRADLSPKNRELVEFHLQRSCLMQWEIAEKVKILQKSVSRINQAMINAELSWKMRKKEETHQFSNLNWQESCDTHVRKSKTETL